MNAHTERILVRMNGFIDSFLESKIGLGKLVNDLEGSLNALEEELSDSFYPNWYEYWGNLEIELAVSLSNKTEPNHETTGEHAVKLKQHIQSYIDDTPTRG